MHKGEEIPFSTNFDKIVTFNLSGLDIVSFGQSVSVQMTKIGVAVSQGKSVSVEIDWVYQSQQ